MRKETRITRLTKDGIASFPGPNGQIVLKINKPFSMKFNIPYYDIIRLDDDGYLHFGFSTELQDRTTAEKRPIEFEKDLYYKKIGW